MDKRAGIACVPIIKQKKGKTLVFHQNLLFAVNSDANISAIFISIISCLKIKI